jgi:hypothetical protein
LRHSGAGSMVRSSSRRSARAGSVKSLILQTATDPDELHSAFYCPVPTTGAPTDVLAARFQSMLLPILIPIPSSDASLWPRLGALRSLQSKRFVSSDANVMRHQQPGGKS